MLKSMTGYGKAECRLGPDKYLVEIRSVNGKTADITFKTQLIPRDKEPEVRKYLADKLWVDMPITQAAYEVLECPKKDAIETNSFFTVLEEYYGA